ncbi:hypothetical protein QZH41_015418 [Actinostola sp. cb2023]|nr:hypothetical protein QZH41_015418 [Actinostola sp. cb2023]
MEKENPATSPSTPLPFTHAQDANDQASGPPQIVIGAPSPANRVSLMNKSKFPKKSPVATVLPQIQVKPREYDQSKFHTNKSVKFIESFSYEWETYGTELRSRYGIEDVCSTNHN